MAKTQQEANTNIEVSLPNGLPILYTDMVFMHVNEDGVIIDVCQKGPSHNQYQVVTRIGMSKEHAKKFVKKLGETLVLTTAQAQSKDGN